MLALLEAFDNYPLELSVSTIEQVGQAEIFSPPLQQQLRENLQSAGHAVSQGREMVRFHGTHVVAHRCSNAGCAS